MKKLLTFSAIIFISFTAKSQLDKGDWLVGGNASFKSYNAKFDATTVSTEYKTTDLQIAPNVGYFLADKFAIGVRSTFSWIKNTGISANAGKSNTIRIDYGPFARFYFLDKEKSVNLLADLSYQFGNLKFLNKDKGIRNTLRVMAGSVVYFNSSIGLEFLAGYQVEKEKLTKSTSTPAYLYTDTKSGFQISVGFQIYLQNL